MAYDTGSAGYFVAMLCLATSAALECLPMNQCACKMSDGSGVVDLSQLSLSQLLVADVLSSSLYIYQPCQPFTIGSECQAQVGTVLCRTYLANATQHSQSLAHDSDVQFLVDSKGSVTIRYYQQNAPSSFAVDVTLVCTKNVTSFSLSRGEQDDNKAMIVLQLQSPAVCLKNPSVEMHNAGAPRLSFAAVTTPNMTTTTSAYITPSKASPSLSPKEECDRERMRDLEVAVPVSVFGTFVVSIVLFVLFVHCRVFRRPSYRSI